MASTIGINLRVTGHCNQGGRKYMEDAFLVAYQQTEDENDLEYAYFGIFDGHGGREAAQYAKEHLMNNIVNQKNFWSDCDDLVLRAIREGFITTHMAMWKEVANWPKTMTGLPSTSGTTASIAFIRRGKMFTGHVGDSKIILGSRQPDSKEWYPRPLTNDHKPESPLERERIYNAGGCVMNKAGVERVVWYRPRIGHKGPVRRSTRVDRIPFLAVARSLGDLWSYNYQEGEFVVSPEPDVGVVTLDPKWDRCILLASDGLWNMLTPQLAVTIAQETEEANELIILESDQSSNSVSKPANNPSKILVDRALTRWYFLNMRADNTSVVTVMLDPPGPPKREVLLRQRVMQKLRPREEIDDSNDAIAADGQSECEPLSDKKSEDSKKRPQGASGETIRSPILPKPVVLTPKRVVVQRGSSSGLNESPPHLPTSSSEPENAEKSCEDVKCGHKRCEMFRKVLTCAANCRTALNQETGGVTIVTPTPTIPPTGNENNSLLLNEETEPKGKVLRSSSSTNKIAAVSAETTEHKRKWTEDGAPSNSNTAVINKQVKSTAWNDVSSCRVQATRSLCTRSRLRTSKVKD